MSASTAPQCDLEKIPWWIKKRHELGGSLASGIMHLLLLLMMALYILPPQVRDQFSALTLDTEVDENQPIEPAVDFEIVPQVLQSEEPVPEMRAIPAEKVVEDPSPVELDLDVEELLLASQAEDFLGALPKLGGLGGRTEQGRAALTRAFGGTAASEAAVSEGLEWLKRHQRQDGSWSFDHHGPDCDDTCSFGGNLRNATVAATAMALLCFVGAGHTHEGGAYQEQVAKGLEFLKQVASRAPEPGDMRQTSSGNSGMYTQGLVAIFLCELHGLTRDREVGRAAQACVRFIVSAQNSDTGGWRYQPGDEGDTSVVGWQVMALTSARMARLNVPSRTRKLATEFLDSVQMGEGAFYGYVTPQKKASTTSIGLLCRMYLGWKRDHPGLATGVAWLSQLGPSRDNMYYNYYATQVLHHWGGEEWKRWNALMREMLIQTQVQAGHSRGSWAPRDPHAAQGGRHYMTCLAILTLEVYYRHLPIYQQRSVEMKVEN